MKGFDNLNGWHYSFIISKSMNTNRAKKPSKNVVNAPLNKPIPHQSQLNTELRLLNDKPENKEKKTVAVIITFTNGSSYDQLFTTFEQKAMEGTKVEVYACSSFYLEKLINAFEGKPHD
jgi:hypothetical protein